MTQRLKTVSIYHSNMMWHIYFSNTMISKFEMKNSSNLGLILFVLIYPDNIIAQCFKNLYHSST